MKLSRVLPFLAVLILITVSGHVYLWRRLVLDPGWPAGWTTFLTGALIGLWTTLPLTMIVLRFAPPRVRSPLAWVAYTWLGFGVYLVVFALVADAGGFVARATGHLPHPRDAALAVTTAAMIVGAAGILRVQSGFVVKRVRVELARMPAGKRYTIAQISDVHVGPTIGRAFVEKLVREVNALGADAIAITGDLVDGTVRHLGEAVEPLRELSARDGVYFVTGNHEYYWGADAWIALLERLGVRVLRNARVRLADAIELAGVDDWQAAQILRHHGTDVAGALEGRDPALPVVLLAHNPKTVDDAVQANVDLMLSGHVHGGQFAPFTWLARFDQPMVKGLFRRGATWIYVSTGTGYWGPPMRVGTVSEVTLIELAPPSPPGP